MIRWVSFRVASTFIVAIFLSCGVAKKPPMKPPGSEILPDHIGSTGWLRDREISRFVGDSLFRYIDGAAEMYHKYDFIEVSVADYHKEESTITAEVYRFADSDRAFGMYTTLRPEIPDTIMLGVEGFTLGTYVVFVRGPYMVNVHSYEESEEMISHVSSIAATIGSLLPGTDEKPEMFDIFPQDGRLGFTEKIYAESFLGQEFLTDVYTVDYSLDDRRFTLFAAKDQTSAKFQQWSHNVVLDDDATMGLEHLPFEGGKVLLTTDAYHGSIVAGVQAGRLVGMVGFHEEYLYVLGEWLRSLSISTED